MKKIILFLILVMALLVISCVPAEDGALAGQAIKPSASLEACNRNTNCKQAYNACVQSTCASLKSRELTQCRSNCLTTASATLSAPVATAPTTPPTAPSQPTTPTVEYSQALDTSCRRDPTCRRLDDGCVQANCAAGSGSTASFISCHHNCTVSASMGQAAPVSPCDDAHPNFCNTRDTCIAANNYWVAGQPFDSYTLCRDSCSLPRVADEVTHLCVLSNGVQCSFGRPEECQSGYCNYYANNRQGACEPYRECEANWECTEWSACHEQVSPIQNPDGSQIATVNVQTRTCTDSNLCGTWEATHSMPTQTQLC